MNAEFVRNFEHVLIRAEQIGFAVTDVKFPAYTNYEYIDRPDSWFGFPFVFCGIVVWLRYSDGCFPYLVSLSYVPVCDIMNDDLVRLDILDENVFQLLTLCRLEFSL